MADHVMHRLAFMSRRGEVQGAPETNDSMVEKLAMNGSLKTEECVAAFRATDRQHFWLQPGHRELAYGPYADMPLRAAGGRLHLSAPHIYARALESLMPLRPGMSFLNIGSGTGYFNCIVSEMIGSLAVNHGIEIWPETVDHANERCSRLGKDSIEFTVGNIYQLDVSKTIRYDRVYVGACANSRSKYLYRLLEVGGILIGPFQYHNGHLQQLRRVVRTTETQFRVEVLGSVQFASLIEPRVVTPPNQDVSDMEDVTPESASPVSSGFARELSRRASADKNTEEGSKLVGLPGVPFTFALSERPWTPERCRTYPLSFRKVVTMGLLCRPQDPMKLCLPTEIWMKHIFPWCPRWWFEVRTRASPSAVPQPPPAVADALGTASMTLPPASQNSKDADIGDEISEDGMSTRATSSGVTNSTNTTPESRPIASPSATNMEATPTGFDEDEDVLFEVFDNGQRHVIGMEGDPDDVEPAEEGIGLTRYVNVPLDLIMSAGLENHGRMHMWAALEARRRLGLALRSEADSDSEEEGEAMEDMDDDTPDADEDAYMEMAPDEEAIEQVALALDPAARATAGLVFTPPPRGAGQRDSDGEDAIEDDGDVVPQPVIAVQT